jgi:hypothetical protein
MKRLLFLAVFVAGCSSVAPTVKPTAAETPAPAVSITPSASSSPSATPTQLAALPTDLPEPMQRAVEVARPLATGHSAATLRLRTVSALAAGAVCEPQISTPCDATRPGWVVVFDITVPGGGTRTVRVVLDADYGHQRTEEPAPPATP